MTNANPDGQPDIAESKLTETKLRESEERLEMALKGADMALWDWNVQTGAVTINERWAHMLGYRVDEIKPHVSSWEKLVHPDDLPQVTAALDAHLNGKTESYQTEYRMLTKDGTWKWILDRGKVLEWDADGKPLRATGTHLDITDRKRTEEKLRKSEARLKEAQRLGHIGSWELDLRTNALTWSDEIYRIFDMEPQAFGATCEAFLAAIHPDDRDMVDKAYTDSLKNKTPYAIDHRLLMKDGSVKWVHERCETWFDEKGQPLRSAGTVQDITERKKAIEERERLQLQLAQAQKMESVGRLAGGVAHDFNNMLGVIIGHTELAMMKTDPTEPVHRDLEKIMGAARRSADLTRQLLAFARKQTISPRPLDLNDTIDGMLKLLRRLIRENVELLWEPGKGPLPVVMDPAQLDQILANLCVNAQDAIAIEGRITIRTGTAFFDEGYCSQHLDYLPGDYVLLEVSDNGCGMDAETCSHIFEPFFTTKEAGKGTGLGLASVYGAVKQNNGFINVYSEPGCGTTFRIYLPAHRDRAASDDKEAGPHVEERGHETILLAEDEPTVLDITSQMLEMLGYQVLAARTPAEAIRQAGEHSGHIDLLMTDVVMPGMNGRALAEKILSFKPGIKRLFMSGYPADVITHQGMLETDVHFIQKPFSKEKLATKIREVLEKPHANG